MRSQRVESGQTFTIRVPERKFTEVVTYLDSLRTQMDTGFNRVLFELIEAGMVAEGLLKAKTSSEHGKAVKKQVPPTTPVPTVQPPIDLGNF